MYNKNKYQLALITLNPFVDATNRVHSVSFRFMTNSNFCDPLKRFIAVDRGVAYRWVLHINLMMKLFIFSAMTPDFMWAQRHAIRFHDCRLRSNFNNAKKKKHANKLHDRVPVWISHVRLISFWY